MTTSWQDSPYVFITLPTCPFCGSGSLITVRSESAGDGSVMRKTVCKKCSNRFRLVVEPGELPEFGRDDDDVL